MRLTWPFDAAGAPPQGQPGDDGVLVGVQAGDERGERWLVAGGCCGHPLLELAAAAAGHDRGERADVPRRGRPISGELVKIASRLAWSAGSRSPGLVIIQAVTALGLGGSGSGAGRSTFPRKRARWSRTLE
jgi:hypothetical protein